MTRFCLSLALSTVCSLAADLPVENPAALRQAIAAAKPGDRVLLAPGNYGGNYFFDKLRGEKGKPILIAAADPQRPPAFTGGKVGIQLRAPAYVELHHLSFADLALNGLNIDDGSASDFGSAQHLVLKGLAFRKVGSNGNHDAIKLSGLTDFLISECDIEGWGSGGSGIDMVGCHRGTIERSRFSNPDAPNSTGVQCKGGTSDITIQHNRFTEAGGRGINIGGSTGLVYFRPTLQPGAEHAEARNIRVERNQFTGSLAPICFVGVDRAVVQFNTIENPHRWAIRILQETREPGFVPCRHGEFTDNIVLFRSTHWSEGGVNIGAGVAAETFKFARNWWQCTDRPDRSSPKLPTAEVDGKYGQPLGDAQKVAGHTAPARQN